MDRPTGPQPPPRWRGVALAVIATASVAITVAVTRTPDAGPPPTTAPPASAGRGPRATTSPAGDPFAAPKPLLGVNLGRGRRSALDAFERWLGRPVSLVQDSLQRSSWATIRNPDDELLPWDDVGRELVLTVPMLPRSGATLRAGSRGEYDAAFADLARRLVETGHSRIILRLGHEANASWFPWSAARAPSAYVAYWRRIVSVMRSVPGAEFRFDWTVARGPQAVPADRIYPGDDVVDIIGMDVYDRDPLLPPGPARWTKFLEQHFGLNWLASFAAEHRKPVSISEWGLSVTQNGNGGGDNPYFIDRMWEWIHAHAVLYHVYFEVDASDGAHRLLSGRFPSAALRFRELFGG